MDGVSTGRVVSLPSLTMNQVKRWSSKLGFSKRKLVNSYDAITERMLVIVCTLHAGG